MKNEGVVGIHLKQLEPEMQFESPRKQLVKYGKAHTFEDFEQDLDPMGINIDPPVQKKKETEVKLSMISGKSPPKSFEKVFNISKRIKKQLVKNTDSDHEYESLTFGKSNSNTGSSRKTVSSKKIMSARRQLFQEQLSKLKNMPDPIESFKLTRTIKRESAYGTVTKPNIMKLLPNPGNVLFIVNAELGKILGVQKITKSTLTSKFVGYALKRNLIDSTQNFYLIHKDPKLYGVLRKARIRVDDIFNHLKRFLTPIE